MQFRSVSRASRFHLFTYLWGKRDSFSGTQTIETLLTDNHFSIAIGCILPLRCFFSRCHRCIEDTISLLPFYLLLCAEFLSFSLCIFFKAFFDIDWWWTEREKRWMVRFSRKLLDHKTYNRFHLMMQVKGKTNTKLHDKPLFAVQLRCAWSDSTLETTIW